MFSFSIVLTIYIGFIHAFEADHLLAVSNIVSQRSSLLQSIKDGMVWGLGHATTIVLIGIIALLLKVKISPHYFHYLEAFVGIMLIVLGAYRLITLYRTFAVPNNTLHNSSSKNTTLKNTHALSYSVGLVHGIAGSGELVLLTMLQFKSAYTGIVYLIVFATGAIAGMMVAAAACSIPFYKKLVATTNIQLVLKIASALLCIGYGFYVLYKNTMY